MSPQPKTVREDHVSRVQSDHRDSGIIQQNDAADANRVKIALLLKPMIEAKAKANQKAAGGAVPLKSAEPIETRKEVAKAAGVSHDTVRKVEAVLASNDAGDAKL